MTANEILHLVTRMPGAVAVTASEADRAPEPAWGDTFIFYAPEGDAPGNRRFPFATIVIKVSAGFDTASNLNRPGVFPLNIAVGRDKFRELIGYSPAAHTGHRADFDYAPWTSCSRTRSTHRNSGSTS